MTLESPRVRRIRWAVWVVILLAIGAAAGAQRIWLSDFVAINGDFQTYNVLRRFLDGQVPYRDFSNYLGMGVLWVNFPFLLLHNTFTASLFITNAVTAVACSVTVWLLLWLTTRRQTLSMAIGALTPLLYQWEVTRNIFILFVPGASMRMVRAFLPVLLAGLLLFASRRSGWDGLDWFHSRRSMCLCGGVLGAAAVWANDFGYSAIGAGICILFVLTVFRNPGRRPLQKLADYLSFLGCAAAAFLVMVTVVTAGSPQSFFSQSAGVASWQFWYYNMNKFKFFTLEELLLGNPQIFRQFVAAAVILLVFVVLFLLNRLTLRGVAVLFIQLTGFFAQLLYGYGSGHFLSGFLHMTNVLIAAGALLRLLLLALERLPLPPDRLPRWLPAAASGAVLLPLCALSVHAAWEEAAPLYGPREGTYVAQLDGWFTNGEQLLETAQILDAPFFSTYASALETIQGVFQPSGTDYIIHALGDRQRQDYLDTFRSGDYPYAVTIRKEYNLWEWWIQRANWDFYRELFSGYVPVHTSDYALIWQRQEDSGAVLDSQDVTVETRRVSEDAIEIQITAGESLAGMELVADLALSYETGHTDPSLHYAAMIQDGTLPGYDGVYYLREGEQSTHIPVIIKDGVGQVTVVARPEERSRLVSVSAGVECLFDQSVLQNAFFG